jgi:peptidoglycan/xylan/chitin deacetylase (PgdA/CDA1 family)
MLDPAYLDYPKRRLGMDHELYPYSNMFERPPLRWPGGAAVAIPVVVSLEWFPITPADKPFRAPGHMQTSYPDYRHYTSRDYGTRVGVYRFLEAFAAAGVTAGFATNAAVARRHPELIRDITAAGHEIIAHSTDMNGTIASGLDVEAETALITESLAVLGDVAGRRPRGWLSIARSQSWNTPRLLAQAGLGYMLDWVNDELPYRMSTEAGAIVNLPLNHELSDRQMIAVQQQSADSFATQILDAHDWLTAEAERYGGRMLPLHLTPYIMGLPYRIGVLERLLHDLRARPASWFATPGAIIDATMAQLGDVPATEGAAAT